MKIGIPKSLLYYKYNLLWETFFKELGCEIVLSSESNKEMLTNGINLSIDECCLSTKIYMGHVYDLMGKVDYILVPRFCSFGPREAVCTKLNALYDIVRNTFNNIKLIHYNVDVLKGETEFNGFLTMGKVLKKRKNAIVLAYKKAKYEQQKQERLALEKQLLRLQKSESPKILIVAHSYNTYDMLIGIPITNYLKKLGICPIYADIADYKKVAELSKKISTTLHWTYNKELVGAIEYYKELVDGIIFISTFPCGPDSLVNELCLRKIKNIPMLNIIIDELQAEAGIHTRLESFVDIIKTKREMVYE